MGIACPKHLRALLLAAAFAGLCACQIPTNKGGEDWSGEAGYLFHAKSSLQDAWLHMPMRGETDYSLAIFDGAVAIRAVGRDSASGLLRDVIFDPHRCPDLEWSWAVTALQKSARLDQRDKEDVAASLFLMFGDPGSLLQPNPVPTLRYVWSNEAAPLGAVIDSPYLSGVVRSLVIRNGTTDRWSLEKRDIVADYTRAFGHPPENEVETIALFTDNDQTGEAVEAFYGWAKVSCRDGKAPLISDEGWD